MDNYQKRTVSSTDVTVTVSKTRDSDGALSMTIQIGGDKIKINLLTDEAIPDRLLGCLSEVHADPCILPPLS